MSVRSADQIRNEFLEFFKSKGHTIVPSSPVVPHDDPTLMFANAGMNQFKPIFLGQADPNSAFGRMKRAADTQKCIRAGGKHNDLDDVGHDTYHHTFFEMLGNWSFGDYFKKEAIAWAWELLTQVWGIDKTRLHATYFQGDEAEGLASDAEARSLWASVTDINPAHIHPGNKKDNFWEMGDTGPCGPCSEIHIDLTPDNSGGNLVNAGDARVMEIWNLVFIQFNRGTDGKLSPLPAQHVDTGMGFERVTAVLQGKKSNYDTDVFTPIFAGIQRVTGAPAYTGLLEDAAPSPSGSTHTQLMTDITYRVIADHIRTLTFALTDGAVPSNEGRGYVLRRILRRAVRYGRQYLNVHKPFLCDLVQVVIDAMGHAFPELKTKPARVVELIREEEESFIKTLGRGLELFNESAITVLAKVIATQRGWSLTSVGMWSEAAQGGGATATLGTPDGPKRVKLSEASQLLKEIPPFPGDVAFKLHDTYGFPIDLTDVMAREYGMTVEIATYERLMEEARQRARAGGNENSLLGVVADIAHHESLPPTEFRYSYELGIFKYHGPSWLFRLSPDGYENAESANAGETVAVVTAHTPFYAESGGQVGDSGRISNADSRAMIDVLDTQKVGQVFFHVGHVLEGPFNTNPAEMLLTVSERRRPTMRNHTATHVMNWALREVLEIGGGGKVDQKGSLVDPDKTRFDFSHNKPLTLEEIERIEALCKQQIEAKYTVFTKEVPQADARKINTLRAVFGEKYPDVVRVVSIGADIEEMLKNPQNPEWMNYSVEFCGGTHVQQTGEIAQFVLTAEESVAKGVRRVIGVSGEKASKAIETGRELRALAGKIKAGPVDQIAAGVADLQKQMAEQEIPLRDRHALREAIAELQQVLKQQNKQQTAQTAGALKEVRQKLLETAERVNGVAIIVGELPDASIDQVREASDWLRTQAGSAAVCLGTRIDGKPLILAALTEDLVKKGLKAGDLIKEVAPAIDGRGGGKPILAQAGGNNAEGLPKALADAAAWLKSKLA